jgi:hypothetical protein
MFLISNKVNDEVMMYKYNMSVTIINLEVHYILFTWLKLGTYICLTQHHFNSTGDIQPEEREQYEQVLWIQRMSEKDKMLFINIR